MSNDQGPNMEMRAFIAVVLSLGVMVGYQYAVSYTHLSMPTIYSV